MTIKIIKIYLGLCFCEYCRFSSFWASSLVQLIFLKIYRPLPYVVGTNHRVLIYCL